MVGYLILAVLSFGLSGIAEAVMDTLQFKFSESVFKDKNQMFWNPQISWQNKWKDGCPKFGERFWGSSTYFVFVTDAWHLFKWIRNRFIDISIFSLTMMALSFWYSLFITIFISVLSKLLFEKSFHSFS